MAKRSMNRAALDRVRKKMQAKKGGFQRDPFEWRPPKTSVDEKLKFKLFVLPPLSKDDKCATGKCKNDMEELFYIQVGDHWINKKKYPCPRVYDGDDCPMCEFGFQLLSETDDKASRKKISSAYLPRSQYALNLYFPPASPNPKDLHGKVMFYSMPKTVFDKLEDCMNRDGPGDDDDPQPWGIFYDPTEAYPLIIKIKHKGGYNDYSETTIAIKLQSINKDSEIDKILAMRHDVISKYPERTSENLKNLQKMVDDLLNGGNDSSSSEFDNDENNEEKSSESSESSEDESKRKSWRDKSESSSESSSKEETKEESTSDSDNDSDENKKKLKELLAKIESGDE